METGKFLNSYFGKMLLDEIHFLDLEALAVEVVQIASLGGEGKGQLVGIQCLILPVGTFVQLAVFAIAQQGMTCMGKLGANLVGSAGNQFAFHKTQSIGRCQNLIIGLAGF